MISKIFCRSGTFCGFCGLFAAYSVYVWTMGTDVPSGIPPSAEVRAGYALFQEKNCIACHQLYGLGGYMGPDLTNVITTPGKGRDYARNFLEFGTNRMPNFDFSENDINHLIAWLTYAADSGIYPPAGAKPNWNGTVDYAETREP